MLHAAPPGESCKPATRSSGAPKRRQTALNAAQAAETLTERSLRAFATEADRWFKIPIRFSVPGRRLSGSAGSQKYPDLVCGSAILIASRYPLPGVFRVMVFTEKLEKKLGLNAHELGWRKDS